MRAHTISIITRRRRNARRRGALALALGVCALAIPATASADPTSGDYSRADAIAAGLEDSSQSVSGSDYSSVNSISPPASAPTSQGHDVSLPFDPAPVDPGYSSPNSITGPLSGEPTFVSSPVSDDQFDWGDAALGAGVAMALVAFGGAALLTVRRRTAISPSASTS